MFRYRLELSNFRNILFLVKLRLTSPSQHEKFYNRFRFVKEKLHSVIESSNLIDKKNRIEMNTCVTVSESYKALGEVKVADYLNCVCWGPSGEVYTGGAGGSVVKLADVE